MTQVIITAGARDRGVAEALGRRLAQGPYEVEVMAPKPLLHEAAVFAKPTEKGVAHTPRLTRARAIVVIWSKGTARNDALQEVARRAVVDGARLVSVVVSPTPEDVPYPNVVPVSLTDWNGRDDAHPALDDIAQRVTAAMATPAATAVPSRSPKRLVVFCDGTWSSMGANVRTNVAQAAMAVDRMDAKGMHQVTYYDDGLGATSEGWFRLLAGAFGRGLDDKILAAYRFLTLNYEHGDEIYLFGFSRGAYTVRSLAGLLRTCGILRREYAYRENEAMSLYRRRVTTDDAGNTHELTDRDFKEAVEFRETYSRAWVAMQGAAADPLGRDKLTLTYLGVWDTVGALGIPSIWASRRKYQFHDLRLGPWVQSARHAVALDEKRKTFEAALWTNVGEGADEGRHARAEQIWFPGDHGGVGGGDGREGLSNIALLWLIEGAAAQGLSFKYAILDRFRLAMDPVTPPVRQFRLAGLPLYLPGFGWREGPRDIAEVHASALKRWDATPKYRPDTLKRVKQVAAADRKKP